MPSRLLKKAVGRPLPDGRGSVTVCTYVVAALVWVLAACSSNINSKDAIRQGVIDHLSSRKGLDLNLSSLEVNVVAVSFRANEADATVSFQPMGGGAGGMEIRYTLERAGNRWRVKAKPEGAQPHGAPHGAHGAGGAAPAPAPGGAELPAGHPPIGSGTKK